MCACVGAIHVCLLCLWLTSRIYIFKPGIWKVKLKYICQYEYTWLIKMRLFLHMSNMIKLIIRSKIVITQIFNIIPNYNRIAILCVCDESSRSNPISWNMLLWLIYVQCQRKHLNTQQNFFISSMFKVLDNQNGTS